ncbi:MAG TPA: urea transporter [Gammaproteobacteria bacterium]
MEREPNNEINNRHNNMQGLLRAYATILFLNNPLAGFVILVTSLFFPNLGLAGFIAAVIGLATARALHFPQISSGMHIYNSLLVGLSLGAFYQLDYYLVLLIILGAILAVFLTVALASMLWTQDQLPVLSLPFVIVAMTMAFAARSYESLVYYIPEQFIAFGWLNEQLATFLSTLGAIFFMTHPVVGIVLFAVIFSQSRYLALLAISGYLIGYGLLNLFIGELPPNLAAWSGFNFALTAMAIGGIFTIPGIASFVLAMLAAAIAALITTALQNLLIGYGLPVMAFPFLITTITILAALRRRIGLSAPYLASLPALPEINYERARLARVRNGDINSIPLLVPFYGEWDIYQGFDGEHTHKLSWRHALDFYIQEDGKSFSNQGDKLEDFYCFGLPVLSPVYGTIIRCNDKLKDNPPGEMDTTNNWGNFILILLDTGDHVLLAHLRQNSIKVKEKDRVEPGDVIAACGNSGRSPQPHAHMQAQHGAALDSATTRFHLASVVVTSTDHTPRYYVVNTPQKGDRIQAAEVNEKLAANLHLPVGRCLQYEMEVNNSDNNIKREFIVEVSLSGQYRLHSDTGASAAFEEINGVLAFYDRSGPKDEILDAWLLANGLTPLTDRARSWHDSPSARLYPLNLLQKLWLVLRHPLGCGLKSHYQRVWEDDRQGWKQTSTHQLDLSKNSQAECESIFDPEMGCTEFSIKYNHQQRRIKLINIGLIADQGIPGWTETV